MAEKPCHFTNWKTKEQGKKTAMNASKPEFHALLKDQKFFFGIVIIFSVIKLWLFSAMQITAFGPCEYDELLFLNSAKNLLQGQWLGEYSPFILSKGPVYSFWLAFICLTHIPLLISQHLLYMTGGILLLVFFKKRSVNPVVLILFYIIYIFNPVFELRVLREAIYPALTVLLFAGLTGMYCYKSASFSKLFFSVLLMSIALLIFWFIREEGIWIVPSMGIIMVYIIYKIYSVYNLSFEFGKRVALCLLLPLATFELASSLISSVNSHYYNIYEVVETNSHPFVSAFGAINRIKHENWIRYQPLPEDVRKKLCNVSPAFKSIEPFVPAAISGYDGLLWILRGAVFQSGRAKDGEQSAKFYIQMANEINTACDNGAVDCESFHKTLMPPFRLEYLPLIADAFRRGVKYLSNYIDYPPWHCAPRYSVTPHSILLKGSEDSLKLYKYITHDEMAPAAFCRKDVSKSDILLYPVEYQNPERMGKYRSKLEIEMIEMIKKEYDFVIPAKSKDIAAVDNSVRIRVKSLQYVENLFQSIIPWFIYAALICYLLMAGVDLYLRRLSFFFVLNTAICVGIFCRLLILSIIDATSFPGMYPWYLEPLYPLIIIFIFANLMDLLDMINKQQANGLVLLDKAGE